MVLVEAVRRYLSTWVIPGETRVQVETGQYVQPSGSLLLMSQWVTHHAPRYYPDPGRFIPECWLLDAAAE